MNRIFDIDSYHEIFESLRRNRSRSLLTGFGVFWGIFMLLFLMGGGDGLHQFLESTFDGFATNSGFVIMGETSVPYKGFRSGRSLTMYQEDVEVMKQRVPGIDHICGIIALWGNEAVRDENTTSCGARGVLPEYVYIESPAMKYGRFINKVDVDQERRVCVIGRKIYEDLFPEGGDPCGKFIQVGKIFYEVIGVNVRNSAVSINGSTEEAVMIPMNVVQKIYKMGNRVHFCAMVAKPGVEIKELLAGCNEVLAKRHYYSPDDKKAVVLLNAEEMFGIMDNLFRGLDILIWLVGFGTLLAAAIGVSNIMMVTVKERTVEIGIRRAIGATPKMILTQVMAESVLLTLVAGMIGIVFSVGLLQLVENAVAHSDNPVAFQISFGTAMMVVVIVMALGMLAGLAPAMRAMEIKPVDAMRDE